MIARLVSDPAIVAASVRSTGSGNTSRVISRALATTRSVGHQITGSRDSTARDVIAIAEVRRAQVRTTSSFTARADYWSATIEATVNRRSVTKDVFVVDRCSVPRHQIGRDECL